MSKAGETVTKQGRRAGAVAGRPAPRDDDPAALDTLLADIRACRICRDVPKGPPLPHEPVPVFQISRTARIAICSQAPGIRAHVKGLPFYDPSGVRLRAWLDLDEDTFYDASRIAIIPMGFCFPGHDAKGGDLPPRRECRASWHDRLFTLLPRLELILSVGSYSLAYHLPDRRGEALTALVTDWKAVMEETAKSGPTVIPLPHPSWRNNAWLKRNPAFETALLPVLRGAVAERL